MGRDVLAVGHLGDDLCSRRTRFLAWQPRRIEWWVASVQSVGTVLLNVSTASAIERFTLRPTR